MEKKNPFEFCPACGKEHSAELGKFIEEKDYDD